MMLNTLELNIGRTELIKILNALVYSSYKKPKMADNKIDYLTKLCKKLNVDESELKSIFTVDTRFGFNYKKFLENEVSNNGSRFFLFLMYITVELFDDSDLSKFIENEILVLLHYDENIQKDIKEISKEYIKSTLKVNSNLFLGQNKNREEYQTLTLSTNDKLHGIKRQEKVSFIKIFIHLMWIDNTIDDLESALIDTYMDLLNVRREEIGSNEKYRDIKVLKNIDIQSKWLRSFLMYSFFMFQTNAKPYYIKERYITVTENWEESTKYVRAWFGMIRQYRNNASKLFDILSCKDTTIVEEDFAKNAKNALIALEVVSLFVPISKVAYAFRGVKALRTIASGIANYNAEPRKYGLCSIVENPKSDKVIICIDGFFSEEQEAEQFNDWKDGLNKLNIDPTVIGYKWKSCKYSDVISGGITTWYQAVEATKEESQKLANEISNIYKQNPHSRIILMGHSLGARVIYNTLIELNKSNSEVDQVYLFGGAVTSKDKRGWLSILNAVNKSVYNFYSKNDDVLGKLYKPSMSKGSPIGLDEIEYFKHKDYTTADLYNIDVTEYIGGHTEYKDKLHDLLNQIRYFE